MSYRILFASVAAAALLLSGCTAGEEVPQPERWDFHTRPELDPPKIDIDVSAQPPEDEKDLKTFLGPKGQTSDDDESWVGGLILDSTAEPVWVRQGLGQVWDLRVQEYKDEPVLTWWEGLAETPHTAGEVVMLDDSYNEIARVGMGGDLAHKTSDLHETTITDDDTMFLLSYIKTQTDLSSIGGSKDGWVWEGVVQEVDIASGHPVVEWRSLDDVPVTQSESTIKDGEGTEDDPFDYIHLNSVSEDDDGDSLLVSARNTHAVYQLDRKSADLNWVLGGSASDFEMGEGATFAWQHDAIRRDDGMITLFDNHAAPRLGDTRGLRLDVDEDSMKATVDTEYPAPDDRSSGSQGNLQELDNGNVFIGWGSEPYYSEFTNEGKLLYDATFTGGSNYRAYRFDWQATPSAPPTATKSEPGEGITRVHMSWNGATEVAAWRILSGAGEEQLKETAIVERTGFETAADITPAGSHIVVEALDENNQRIGSTTVG
ncbi:MAG: arylsulfotransferase family protein [Brevibacterium sp.]|uniref:arylsulfotransferase family protein n=1 Tax=Brevibacterium sp. TaxID=1701 RepID=UPI0026489439|nr:arylsulfotransferase family protein [Brevibacterium sp.]MDN5805771.1 arylsulfotransferase family protein [Brevibacterium sp.]MDN5833727.1 arylsulfotransferase family protein [Brevibacterium sp.]MDN5876630.1 arylsulfotransferase family protein [Brevibacterium sp.]MDN5910360.1 arylsulfotransferase family protein [Brevibacterium sp.]MDN6133602.1 arylsulfotransferase family protein [Brevibacterium sp.]